MFPKISSKAFLSPMARVTDPAFRSLCKKFGAGLTVTELINADGLLQNPSQLKSLVLRADNEDSFAVQLFGSDPSSLAKASVMVEPFADFIDLNLGCPAHKVCRLGAGSELLKYPSKVGDIVSAMVGAVDLPVTVKTRLGIDSSSINVLDILRVVENSGASLLTIHGRTRNQAYAGEADWDWIKKVKEESSIPIVGNGDVSSPEIFRDRLLSSGVDYIAVGRAAIGNPFLFRQINDFLSDGSYKQFSLLDRLKVFNDYMFLSQEFKTKLLLQKLQAQHFIKGLKGASQIREKISLAKSSEDIISVVESFIERGFSE